MRQSVALLGIDNAPKCDRNGSDYSTGGNRDNK